MNRLMDLAMVQHWIDEARKASPDNKVVQIALDRRQSDINAQKAKITDEMFEISRSN